MVVGGNEKLFVKNTSTFPVSGLQYLILRICSGNRVLLLMPLSLTICSQITPVLRSTGLDFER